MVPRVLILVVNPGKKIRWSIHSDSAGAKFKAVMSVFISAAFAFSGAEMVGLAAWLTVIQEGLTKGL